MLPILKFLQRHTKLIFHASLTEFRFSFICSSQQILRIQSRSIVCYIAIFSIQTVMKSSLNIYLTKTFEFFTDSVKLRRDRQIRTATSKLVQICFGNIEHFCAYLLGFIVWGGNWQILRVVNFVDSIRIRNIYYIETIQSMRENRLLQEVRI